MWRSGLPRQPSPARAGLQALLRAGQRCLEVPLPTQSQPMPASSSQVFTQAPRGSPATRNASAPQQQFPSAAHTTDAFYQCYSRPFSPSPACPPLFLLWEKKAGFPEFVLYLRVDAKGVLLVFRHELISPQLPLQTLQGSALPLHLGTPKLRFYPKVRWAKTALSHQHSRSCAHRHCLRTLSWESTIKHAQVHVRNGTC